MAQKMRFHARCGKNVPFGGKKVEINNEPHFMPPVVKFWQKSKLRKYLAKKASQWRRSPTNDP